MNKNTYYVIQIEKNGLCYAFCEKVPNCYNLKCIFERYPDMMSINACDSKKEAERIAEIWNDGFMKNGTYRFSRENINK